MEMEPFGPANQTHTFRERVKHAFFALCDLDREHQHVRLHELCGSDAALLREVERLLDNDIKESLINTEFPTISDEWIGKTLKHYKILERIGEGGMGVVYRGEDVRLNRPVAIKLLGARMLGDHSQRERFLREAQAAASLQHPSVCTVYDIGEAERRPYIVTAYLAGETLESAIQLHQQTFSMAIDCAIQLAEGLQAAHSKGIIHRDLKPSNVILTVGSDGGTRATIIDFGLAQVKWGNRLTQAGRLIGTANYICPQLLQGEPIEEQSDIWSLGVILYEMLAGHPPFDAENRERLFFLICHENPKPLTSVRPELPPEIGRIVAKALEKDAERRYRTISNLLSDLRALRRGLSIVDLAHPQPDIPTLPAAIDRSRVAAKAPKNTDRTPRSLPNGRMLAASGVIVLAALSWIGWSRLHTPPVTGGSGLRIAVLPFEDLSAGERNERISQTLAESLAVQLAGFSNVRMVSSSAVRNLRERGAGDHQVSSQLRLDYLVTGHIERSGQTLRATANLISGRDFTIVCSKKVDLPWSDSLTMQNQFAESASREMGVKLALRGPDSAINGERSGDAYDLRMKARHTLLQYLDRQQPEFLETAERRLRRAIDLDPHYSDAFADMADLLMWKLYPPRGNRQALLSEARHWLDRTLQEDPKHLRADRLKGNLHLELGEFAVALEHSRRAVRLSPKDADSLHQLARCYGALGFFESALLENEKAIATDVPTMFPLYWQAWYLTELGRFHEAKEATVKLLEFDSRGIGVATSEALMDLHRGNYRRAREIFERMQHAGFNYNGHAEIGAALAIAASGDVAFGRTVLRKYTPDGPRLGDMNILLAAVSGDADAMVRFTRESTSFASYGWLARNARFFRNIAGRKAFQDLVFYLHRKWEADLAEIGPTLPIRPSELPKPDVFLASLRRQTAR